MGLSNCTEGKRNAIALSGGGEPHQVPVRPAHAPCFARSHDVEEPNVTRGGRLQPVQPRPKREPTRTRSDAHKLGLGGPEALDASAQEMDS